MPSSKPPQDLAALHKWVRANLKTMHSLMSTPGGIDKALMTLSYTLTLLTPQITRTTALLSLHPSVARDVPKRLRALSSLISDVRIFLRLWGLFAIYEWGVNTLRHPPKDVVAKWITLAQVAVNVGFQVMENVAYLASHGVIGIGKRTERRLWAWSSRCWAVHIALEFWKLERERRIRNEKRRSGRSVLGREAELSEEEAWTRSWVTNLTNAPLSIHWSVENGLIPESAVGMLGTAGALLNLKDAWTKSA